MQQQYDIAAFTLAALQCISMMTPPHTGLPCASRPCCEPTGHPQCCARSRSPPSTPSLRQQQPQQQRIQEQQEQMQRQQEQEQQQQEERVMRRASPTQGAS
jgi:hypothetical protein